jgi:flagellar assembly protein FliH
MNSIRRLGQLPTHRLSELRQADQTHAEDENNASTFEQQKESEAAQVAALEEAFDLARDRGFDEGMKDAQREIDRRFDQLRKNLEEEYQQKIEQLNQLYGEHEKHAHAFVQKASEWIIQAEELAIEAAYASLLRIMGDQSISNVLIQSICKKVVREHAQVSNVLRVSEEDALEINSEGIGLSVDIDPALSKGQFVLESNRGHLNTGLDVRLEAIKLAYLNCLQKRER